MHPATTLMTFYFQSSSPEVSGRDIHLIMESEIAIAAVMLLLILGMLVAGIVVLVYLKKVTRIVDELHQNSMPLISKGSGLVDDLGPKVRSITSNIEEISFTARSKVDELAETITQINRTVADINSKTHAQAERVHGIVTDALTTTKHVSESVQEGIRVPVRQVAGVIAGLKAALQTLAERSPLKPESSKTPSKRYDY